jgi:hypothetical protein
MFYSYTRGEHKNIFDRFTHQINAPSSWISLLKSFVIEKRHGAMQKLFIKREKRGEKKMDKCPR